MSLSSCKQKMYECLLQLCCFNAKHHSNWRLTAGYIKCVSLNVSWSELHRTTEALTNTILSAFIQYIHTHAVTHSYTQRCTLKKNPSHVQNHTHTHHSVINLSHDPPLFRSLFLYVLNMTRVVSESAAHQGQRERDVRSECTNRETQKCGLDLFCPLNYLNFGRIVFVKLTGQKVTVHFQGGTLNCLNLSVHAVLYGSVYFCVCPVFL